jgi:hypothetical protein
MEIFNTESNDKVEKLFIILFIQGNGKRTFSNFTD